MSLWAMEIRPLVTQWVQSPTLIHIVILQIKYVDECSNVTFQYNGDGN